MPIDSNSKKLSLISFGEGAPPALLEGAFDTGEKKFLLGLYSDDSATPPPPTTLDLDTACRKLSMLHFGEGAPIPCLDGTFDLEEHYGLLGLYTAFGTTTPPAPPPPAPSQGGPAKGGIELIAAASGAF